MVEEIEDLGAGLNVYALDWFEDLLQGGVDSLKPWALTRCTPKT